jgi:hypothetical protein
MARQSLVAGLVVIAFAAHVHADELTMQDLQALDRQQAWTELLERADQVKPAGRTADWQKLVITAARHVVEQIDRDSAGGQRAAEALVAVVPAAEHRYGFLKADKDYLTNKSKVIVRIVAVCAREGYGGCGTIVDALADGIDRFPAGVAADIARLVSDDKGPAQAIRYWALAADDDKANCRDGRVERAVVDALHGRAGARVPDAQRAAASCIDALEIKLVRELDAAAPKDPFIANACPVLKARGAKTAVKKKCP